MVMTEDYNNAKLDALESKKTSTIENMEKKARELLSNVDELNQQQQLMQELVNKHGKDHNDIRLLRSLLKSENLNIEIKKEKQKQREVRAKNKAKIERLNKKKSALIGEIMLRLKDDNEIVRLAYEEVINGASEAEKKVLNKSS